MEIENAIPYLNNKTILVTGVTGFLAKIFVEKILRAQPNVKKLYLLVRAKDTKSAWQRLCDEVLSKDLFGVLKKIHGDNFDSFISEKVNHIAGDTSLPDLGLSDFNKEEMCNDIDAIVHVAAITKANERYDWSLSINTLGPRYVIDFANKCSQLQILVHVSTAYVCGETPGLILERPCKMGESLNGVPGLNIAEEKRLIDEALKDLTSKGASEREIRHSLKTLGQQRSSLYGWPNTYTFTKAMGEMIVEEYRRHLPVVIIRPTIVCATYKEPFPGWVEGYGSLALGTIFYGKGCIKVLHADRHTVLDLIPADMVVNAMVMAMVANANKASCLTVYQVGSSLRNPVNFGSVMDFHLQYFNKKPWIDDQGMNVIVPNLRWRLVKSKPTFVILLTLQFLKLMVLKLVESASCNTVNSDKLEIQLKTNVKVAELCRPYVLSTFIFDDENTELLRKSGILDEDVFYFDPKCIDWEDYLLNKHIVAVVNYLSSC